MIINTSFYSFKEAYDFALKNVLAHTDPGQLILEIGRSGKNLRLEGTRAFASIIRAKPKFGFIPMNFWMVSLTAPDPQF